jgi:tryptophanyl-tRNA synthetase
MKEKLNKKRILTGDRPTGSLHLGHYVGSLKNRVKLQNEYETFIEIVDLHALTTHFNKTADLQKNIQELMLGYLSVGLDPSKVTFFLQSKVPEILEIAYFLSILTPRSLIARQPALKEKLDQGEQDTVGLFYYPILMAADILTPRANLVPVGKDQKSHVEYARDVAIKFNQTYGEVFPVPEPLIGDVPTLVGTDGKNKMSKSLNNAIYLSDNSATVAKKVMDMFTDPGHIHASQPGKTEGNPVFSYLEAFDSDIKEVEELKKRYQKGGLGDVEVKKRLIEVLNNFLNPIRKRRAEFAENSDEVMKILKEGTEKGRKIAIQTLKEVRQAMSLNYFA